MFYDGSYYGWAHLQIGGKFRHGKIILHAGQDGETKIICKEKLFEDTVRMILGSSFQCELSMGTWVV